MGIIFGVLFLSPHFGIMGVAYGVVIVSVIQLLASVLGLVGLRFDYRTRIYWRNKGFRRVLHLLPPRSLDQGIDYFNNLVETNLASRLSQGAITAYQTAYTLHLVPVTLIGVAISTAAFPKMSERLAQKRPDLFKKDVQQIVRVIIWLAMPVSVIAYFCRGYLVRLLVATGNPIIASLVGMLVASIFFRALYQIVSRCFYAHQNTRIPLYVSIAAISLNVGLAIWLAKPSVYGVFGLAIAQSIVAAFEVTTLFVVLSFKYVQIFDRTMWHAIWRMVSASGLTALVTYAMIIFFPLRAGDAGFFSLVPKFGLIVVVSLSAYTVFSHIFRLDEAKPVIYKVGRFIFKTIGLS
jgi:putative peptidoglycan lipid II flippase